MAFLTSLLNLSVHMGRMSGDPQCALSWLEQVCSECLKSALPTVPTSHHPLDTKVLSFTSMGPDIDLKMPLIFFVFW